MSRIHMKNMDIILEDNKVLYQLGDHIEGKLQISIDGLLQLSMVKIGLIGMSEVKWVEHPGTIHHRDGHIYYEKQKLLDLTIEIQDYRSDCLERGEHELQFKTQLPYSGIPSSFVSDHGCVTYYIEATIDEPSINEIHKIQKQIEVEAPFSENLSISIGGSAEKDMGFMSFGSGIILLHASLVKKGFIKGELIELHCTVENRSKLSATPRATIYQRQIFMSGERHKTIESSLTQPIIGQVVEHNRNNTEIFFLLIPENISLSIKSSLITVKYFIHITLDIPHKVDLRINLPIVITNKHALNDISMKTHIY